MNEMVERVARALAGVRADGWPPSTARLKFLEDDARAAIKAMREPTDAVVTAGDKSTDVEGKSLTYMSNIPNPVRGIWQAMIDAALK